MSSSSTLALAVLRDGPLYRFADWPNPEVPNGRLLDRALRLIHRRLAVGGLAVARRRPLDGGCRLPRPECGAVTEEADDH